MSERPTGSRGGLPSTGGTVLVIDDDPEVRSTLQTVLEELGWSSETAATGQDGIEQAIVGRPTVILLDHHLPDADGLEVLATLRRRGIEAPVVAITGKGDEQLAEKFLTQGAVDYIPKHRLTPGYLEDTLDDALWITHGHQPEPKDSAGR